MTPHTSARTLREDSIAQIVGKVAALSRGEAVVRHGRPPSAVIDPTIHRPTRTTP